MSVPDPKSEKKFPQNQLIKIWPKVKDNLHYNGPISELISVYSSQKMESRLNFVVLLQWDIRRTKTKGTLAFLKETRGNDGRFREQQYAYHLHYARVLQQVEVTSDIDFNSISVMCILGKI